VKKEFFQLLIKDLFDPKYGLFSHDQQNHWFSGSPDFLADFELVGKMMGVAIYNGVILDIRFPPVIYKKIQDCLPDFEDLKESHPALFHGLLKLLEYSGDDLQEAFGVNFQIQYEVFGQLQSHDLLPDGENIPVTVDNRKQFVDLYTKFILVDSIKPQFDAFLKGFRTVCMSPAFELFHSRRLAIINLWKS